MGRWRFLAYDLLSGSFLTELPVTSWSSSDPLTGVGSWSATVDVRGSTSSTARQTVVADSTRRGRALIVAERDGVPVFDGIVWRRGYSARSSLLTLAGANLKSYFNHWTQAAALGPFTAVDQFEIFRQFVAAVQTAPSGNIGVIVDSGNSGKVRDRSIYPAYSGKKLGELMSELAGTQDGFEYTIGVEYNAGVVERRCRLFSPRRGRDLSATNLRFYSPGNAVLFDVDEDGSNMAVTVVGLGAGDGADMLTATVSQTDLLAAGWPGYREQRSWKDVSVLNTLNEHAAAEVRRLSGVDVESFTIAVDVDSVGQPFGSWTIGDDALLVVQDDAFYPAQVDGSPGLVSLRRVLQHDWRVQGSSEELVVTLGLKVLP